MSESEPAQLSVQQCAQEMFAMLVDTPDLDPVQIKMAFNLGFFKTWTVADIQEEMRCLKALLVSLIVTGAFGFAKATRIVPEFQALIYAAARKKPLFARIEKNFPDYWKVMEQRLDRAWNGSPQTFPLQTLAAPLGQVFASHCRLKQATEAVRWVSNILEATLPSVEDLRCYEVL